MLRRQSGSLCSALQFWVRVVNEHYRAAPAVGTGRAPAALPSAAAQGGTERGCPFPPGCRQPQQRGRPELQALLCRVRVSGVRGCGSRLQSHEALRRAAASRVCVRVRVPALAPLSQEVLRKAVAPSLSARFPECGD